VAANAQVKGTGATVLVRGSRLLVASAALVGSIAMYGNVHDIFRELSHTGRHHVGEEECNDLSDSGQRYTRIALIVAVI
jgi:hypothetical protein